MWGGMCVAAIRQQGQTITNRLQPGRYSGCDGYRRGNKEMQIQWGGKQSRAKLFKDQREPKCALTEKRGMRAIFQRLKMPVKDTPAWFWCLWEGEMDGSVCWCPPHRETEQRKGRPLHGGVTSHLCVSCCSLRFCVDQDLHHPSAPTSVSLLFADKCQM